MQLHHIRTTIVPLLKYTFFAGASLLALLLVAERTIPPARSAAPQDSWSLDVLRKMANHGEMRPFASAAAAGPFLAMPVVAAQPGLAAGEAPEPAASAIRTEARAMDAQARFVEAEPARPATTIANRKPKQRRAAYVENNMRGRHGVFEAW